MADISHKTIALRYRRRISFTFALLAGENLIILLEPWLLGRAIDGLIARDPQPLLVFLAVSLVGLIVAISRRLYDTRAYAGIYRDVSEEVAAAETRRGAAISRSAARIGLVKEVVDFFEHYLPMSFTSALMLLGAGAMLFLLSTPVGLAVLATSLGVALIFALSRKRIHFLNQSLNDELEKQVDILEQADPPQRQAHFQALSLWRIRLSDLEARNFGLSDALIILLTLFALYQTVWIDGLSTGQTFSVLTYLLQFSQGVMLLPYMYQEYVRTSEIGTRVGREDGDEEAAMN